ncbi:DNA glycosylase [Trinorchestia longiramus]|nr:DNA glycosylase [Trinorchestia longiramus]
MADDSIELDSDKEFLANSLLSAYESVFLLYESAVSIKESLRAKKSNLGKLDLWYQKELPDIIRSRKAPHLKHDELVKLMEWKLARGKFRPRLVDLVTSNPKDFVEETTAEGLKLAKSSTLKALKTLCKLKGVGPATASAILAAGAGERYAFFADEVAYAALKTQTLKYSDVEYAELNYVLQGVAKRLNKEESDKVESADTTVQWTPHKVELTVWCYSVLRQNKPELLRSIFKPDASRELSNKRKNVANDRSAKKRKHERSGPITSRSLAFWGRERPS